MSPEQSLKNKLMPMTFSSSTKDQQEPYSNENTADSQQALLSRNQAFANNIKRNTFDSSHSK